MKKLNDIGMKLFNLKWYYHFIIWFFLTLGIFFLGFKLLVHVDIPEVMVKMAICISVIMAGLATMANGQVKASQEYYKVLEHIENVAKRVTTVDGLNDIKMRLLKHMNSNAVHSMHYAEANKVLTMINTRLQYEFKQAL